MNIENVDVDSLILDPKNARKHSRESIDAIKGSLELFGVRKPLVVWENVVIAGNGMLTAIRELGWKKVTISRVPSDWSYDMVRAYALADNRTGDISDFDDVLLADQLLDLDAVGFDVSMFGFVPLVPPLEPNYVEPSPPKPVTCPDCGLEFIAER